MKITQQLISKNTSGPACLPEMDFRAPKYPHLNDHTAFQARESWIKIFFFHGLYFKETAYLPIPLGMPGPGKLEDEGGDMPPLLREKEIWTLPVELPPEKFTDDQLLPASTRAKHLINRPLNATPRQIRGVGRMVRPFDLSEVENPTIDEGRTQFHCRGAPPAALPRESPSSRTAEKLLKPLPGF